MNGAHELGTGIVGRILLAMIGLGVAFLGFSLVLSVFLAFIGLPMFIFGLAMAQAQAPKS
jgi:hypothetical protein